jgi:dTDP-4-dehydrorhamnose reductase
MMQTNNSLIIGADGALGSSLKEYLISRNETVIESTRRRNTCTTSKIFLDLSVDVDDAWTPPSGVSVAYFCAAVTSLERCYTNPVESAQVNVHNTVKLARKCMENGVFVIYPSTNLVFDGTIPFRKTHENVSPRTEYGRQKAEAEKRLLSLGNDIAVVRFTKIIDPRLPLIIRWLESLRSNSVIHPFLDYVMAPVPSSLAVECLYRISKDRLRGIHHVSGPQDISYADVAYHIAHRLNAKPDLVLPNKIGDSGVFLEHNPTHTTLDSTETEKKLAIKIPDAFSSIDRMFFP